MLIPSGNRKSMHVQTYRLAQTATEEMADLNLDDNVMQQQAQPQPVTQEPIQDAQQPQETPVANEPVAQLEHSVQPNGQQAQNEQAVQNSMSGFISDFIQKHIQPKLDKNLIKQYNDKFVKKDIGPNGKTVTVLLPAIKANKEELSDDEIMGFCKSFGQKFSLHFMGANNHDGRVEIKFSSNPQTEAQPDPLEAVYGKPKGERKAASVGSTMGEMVAARKVALYEQLRKIGQGK